MKTTLLYVAMSHHANDAAPQVLEQELPSFRSMPVIDNIVLVTNDTKILMIARHQQVKTVQVCASLVDENCLSRVLERLAVQGTERVLILNAAYSFARPFSISLLLKLPQKPNSIVLIPSQSDQDTQAALLMPPDSISITMGKNSFQENIRRARQANITLITHMYLHSQRELEYASMNSTRA